MSVTFNVIDLKWCYCRHHDDLVICMTSILGSFTSIQNVGNKGLNMCWIQTQGLEISQHKASFCQYLDNCQKPEILVRRHHPEPVFGSPGSRRGSRSSARSFSAEPGVCLQVVPAFFCNLTSSNRTPTRSTTATTAWALPRGRHTTQRWTVHFDIWFLNEETVGQMTNRLTPTKKLEKTVLKSHFCDLFWVCIFLCFAYWERFCKYCQIDQIKFSNFGKKTKHFFI